MENSKILIRNAAQIVTCHGDKARRGAEMSDLGVIEDGAVAMSDGVITHVGPTEEVLRNIHAAVSYTHLIFFLWLVYHS